MSKHHKVRRWFIFRTKTRPVNNKLCLSFLQFFPSLLAVLGGLLCFVFKQEPTWRINCYDKANSGRIMEEIMNTLRLEVTVLRPTSQVSQKRSVVNILSRFLGGNRRNASFVLNCGINVNIPSWSHEEVDDISMKGTVQIYFDLMTQNTIHIDSLYFKAFELYQQSLMWLEGLLILLSPYLL